MQNYLNVDIQSSFERNISAGQASTVQWAAQEENT